MPYTIRKVRNKRKWRIIRNRDHKVVGTSNSLSKAKASARIRESAHKG